MKARELARGQATVNIVRFLRLFGLSFLLVLVELQFKVVLFDINGEDLGGSEQRGCSIWGMNTQMGRGEGAHGFGIVSVSMWLLLHDHGFGFRGKPVHNAVGG